MVTDRGKKRRIFLMNHKVEGIVPEVSVSRSPDLFDRLIHGSYRWPLRLDLPFRLAVELVGWALLCAVAMGLLVAALLLLRLVLPHS
jgi:hypothetical protein